MVRLHASDQPGGRGGTSAAAGAGAATACGGATPRGGGYEAARGLGADTTATAARFAPTDALLDKTFDRRRLSVEATRAAPPRARKAAAPPTIARHTNTETATVAPLTPAADAALPDEDAALPDEAADATPGVAAADATPGVAGKARDAQGLERSFIPMLPKKNQPPSA